MPSIRAAVVREKSGPFLRETIQLEELHNDEVLVRIHGVGVCHTDLVVRNQYFPTPLPAVLGHEGSGVMEKVGASVTTVAPGDHVVRQAVDCLRLTGICGVIGVAPLGTEVALDMNGILFGRTVRGIIEGDSVPQNFIPRLVDLYAEGRFPFDRLIRTYPLEQIEDAVSGSESGQVLKAVLLPGGASA